MILLFIPVKAKVDDLLRKMSTDKNHICIVKANEWERRLLLPYITTSKNLDTYIWNVV